MKMHFKLLSRMFYQTLQLIFNVFFKRSGKENFLSNVVTHLKGEEWLQLKDVYQFLNGMVLRRKQEYSSSTNVWQFGELN